MFPKLDYIKQLVEGLCFAANKRFVNLEKFAEDAKAKLDTLLANRPNWNQNDETAVDFVKSRTHYDSREQVIIEWDGNTEGKTQAETNAEVPFSFCKVSDLTPSQKELLTGSAAVIMGGQETPCEIVSMTIEDLEGFRVFVNSGIPWFIVVSEAGASDTIESGQIGDVTFPEIGIYVLGSNGIRFSYLTYTMGELKPLDPKFIVFTSPNGTKYQITVGDDGVLTTTAVTE